jgi:hypothetical protein
MAGPLVSERLGKPSLATTDPVDLRRRQGCTRRQADPAGVAGQVSFWEPE